MAVVELKNVSKIYEGKSRAVDNISLEIRDKEFLVLVGPSGCGKSTTLRMIAGLEDISGGEISIDGKIVNNILPKDRDIAMVFQNYALYPHMTVYDNMAFGLKLRKFSKKEIAERVNYAAGILEIEDLLKRKPRQLSGGQRQRVALGRAIVRKPKVFLFDEPLSNLDAKLRVQMRTEIARLHHRLETTMIYVTHDQVEAMTLGDRIVVMKDGIIQQVDSPLNLYNKPDNRFVAGFIGSPAMNFIEGKISAEKGIRFVSSKGDLTLKSELEFPGGIEQIAGASVTAGIRPENFNLLPTDGNRLTVKIDLEEQMGSEAYLHFNIDETHCIARVKPDCVFPIGSEIEIGCDPQSVLFFNREGIRIKR
jgi:multiple sugar transport system ATP-binding protein